MDIESVLRVKVSGELTSLRAALAAFSGMDELQLKSAIEELFAADDEFLLPENLNLQLGLLCGQPLPRFPFVTSSAAHQVALLRPLLDTARNLLHAAVRIRMQALPAHADNGLWRAVADFVRCAVGDSELGKVVALATIADVISDIIVFNSDAPKRVADAVLAEKISHVLRELEKLDLGAIFEVGNAPECGAREL